MVAGTASPSPSVTYATAPRLGLGAIAWSALGLLAGFAGVAFVGVTGAVVVAGVIEPRALDAVGFAYAWCGPAAFVLAGVAYGLLQLAARFWQRVQDRPAPVLGRRRPLNPTVATSAQVFTIPTSSTSTLTSTPSTMLERPPWLLLGVLVSVPLAFGNAPGWMANHYLPIPWLVVDFFAAGISAGLALGVLARLRSPSP